MKATQLKINKNLNQLLQDRCYKTRESLTRIILALKDILKIYPISENSMENVFKLENVL